MDDPGPEFGRIADAAQPQLLMECRYKMTGSIGRARLPEFANRFAGNALHIPDI